jgi:hypothetical protein
MYNGTIDYKPAATRNFGQLVEPPVPLNWQDAIVLPGSDAPGLNSAEAFNDHWVILYAVPDPCLDTCLRAVSALRQIHRASGRHQARIRIALLVQDDGSTNVESTLHSTYSWFQLIRDPDGKVASTLQRTAGEQGAVYFMDPLGNIMMRYKEGTDPNNLKQDLIRLLTWSKLDKQ